jgi:hypothetical protein
MNNYTFRVKRGRYPLSKIADLFPKGSTFRFANEGDETHVIVSTTSQYTTDQFGALLHHISKMRQSCDSSGSITSAKTPKPSHHVGHGGGATFARTPVPSHRVGHGGGNHHASQTPNPSHHVGHGGATSARTPVPSHYVGHGGGNHHTSQTPVHSESECGNFSKSSEGSCVYSCGPKHITLTQGAWGCPESHVHP